MPILLTHVGVVKMTEQAKSGAIVDATTIEPVPQVDAMLSVIERVALDPNSDIDKLERMLAMKERMEAQSSKAAHSAALVRAMASMPDVPMNGMGHNKRPYATLKDITKATRGVLSENGLALTFGIDTGDEVQVTAILSHISGHSTTVSISLPKDTSGSKNGVQSVGSSQTYGQRYAAQAILGLSLGDDVDDDGVNEEQTLSPEQYIKLRDLIEQSGADLTKFLLAYGANSLEQFPLSKFASGVAALERKKSEAK